FQRVATAFGRVQRSISQNVKFVLLAPDFLQPGEQIVGVENIEAAGSVGERRENLLVRGCRRRKLRNDAPRLTVIRIVEMRIRHSAATRTPSRSSAAAVLRGRHGHYGIGGENESRRR